MQPLESKRVMCLGAKALGIIARRIKIDEYKKRNR